MWMRCLVAGAVPGLPYCRLPMGASTIYEIGLGARRPGLVVVLRIQVTARVETRLRLRMRVRAIKMDCVYVTVPTREAKGSAVGHPCAPPVRSGNSREKEEKEATSTSNGIDITIHCGEMPQGRASKVRLTRLEWK